MSLKVTFALLIIYVLKSDCFNFDVNSPIIYVDPNNNVPNSSKRSSYFGYSLVLKPPDANSQAWIQIGAPRGNHSLERSFEPGAAYRCPIFGPCNLLMLNSGRPYTAPRTSGGHYKKKNDGAWVGNSMDLSISSGRVVTCAPRWINQYFTNRYFMQGACSWSKVNYNNTEMLIPLAGDKNTENGVYYYALGEAGTSVHMPENTIKPELLIGAPGFYNWKGNVILYRDGREDVANVNKRSINVEDFSDLIIPNMLNTNGLHSFNLFGYSVTSGRFFSNEKLFYVSGAPKSTAYKGLVLVFDFPPHNLGNIVVNQTREGTMIGEYFGASLGVADVNGDMLDDLLVGAPYYSSKYDEGRVYIFLGNSRGNLLTPDQDAILEGTVPGGQFGLAIQNLGDLDGDGFEDVVIGAPYEDDDHGTIYIYNGRSSGLNPIASQKIAGKNISPLLKGFGISFSKGIDIDDNKFNDLAIGAHLSGHAVLLRSQPVVKLNLQGVSLTSRLNHSATTFEIEVCYWFTGSFLPITLTLYCDVQVDVDHNRAYYMDGNRTMTDFRLNNIVVFREQNQCEKFTIFIKPNNTKYLDPIMISLTPGLEEETSLQRGNVTWIRGTTRQKSENFCKSCPVLYKRMKPKTAKIEVPFALNCGDDNVCHADLKVLYKFIGVSAGNKFVIGSKSSIQMEITLENSGEPAYVPQVIVKLPENVYLSITPPTCEYNIQINENNKEFGVIECSVDNILEMGQLKTLTLDFDMDQVTTASKLNFTVVAVSTSPDLNYGDNSGAIQLNLVIEADIKIRGNSDRDSYFYGDVSTLNLQHLYEVQKTGASPLELVDLDIIIPTTLETKTGSVNFLQIYKPMGYQFDQPFTCRVENGNAISDLKPTSEMGFERLTNEELQDDGMEEEEDEDVLAPEEEKILLRRKRSEEMADMENEKELILPQANRTLFLNCSNIYITCLRVSCTIGPFKKSSNVALTLKMVVNITVLEPIMGQKDIIFLSTDGHIKEIYGNRSHGAKISSLILGKPKETEIDWWIIIVAIITGVLLLMLVTMGLVKAGFFQRTKKQQLMALKEAEIQSMTVREYKIDIIRAK